ncbi:Beta-mannosidase [Purpureocillium takamizusanense]|uniref:Beta-mannosidase n=1 Tax=Purpureocillium takamizusanense TaxID=2060973 RepID=A0A9Q8QF87_9HYPO|nr:Beta-mannosidase [Purpureocillium takamizusanense]UNI18863.1 Beta-mannosidase [Purpureocillium takamizusanense]
MGCRFIHQHHPPPPPIPTIMPSSSSLPSPPPPPNTTSVVPRAYVLFFLYLDPLTALYGAWLHLADPSAAATAMAPRAAHDPAQAFVYRQAGGLALAVAALAAAVPRLSTDLRVWRALQAALLLADAVALSGAYEALRVGGRLTPAPASWTDDDVAVVGSYVGITLVRALFVLGVGFGETKVPGEKGEVKTAEGGVGR